MIISVLGIVVVAVSVAVFLLSIARDEIIIGKLYVNPGTGSHETNPRKCVHSFERTSTIIVGDRPNRHYGRACNNCVAVLWENGDITISKATTKWR